VKRFDIPQGSAEWVELHRGRPTASRFGSIVTPKTLRPSASQAGLMAELLVERITGMTADQDLTDFMMRGKELEAEAIEAYSFDNALEVERVGFLLDDSGDYGCSPDGLVGEDGGLEVKCLSLERHVLALLGEMDLEHAAQVQGNLWISGRKWWDLYYFNGILPARRVRVERDEKHIAALAELVPAFCARVDDAERRLVQEYGITPSIVRAGAAQGRATGMDAHPAMDFMP